tara:strand:+ start:4182 stop:4970 length:789 start_codon:yes stop_codon:yes gene_type:complete
MLDDIGIDSWEDLKQIHFYWESFDQAPKIAQRLLGKNYLNQKPAQFTQSIERASKKKHKKPYEFEATVDYARLNRAIQKGLQSIEQIWSDMIQNRRGAEYLPFLLHPLGVNYEKLCLAAGKPLVLTELDEVLIEKTCNFTQNPNEYRRSQAFFSVTENSPENFTIHFIADKWKRKINHDFSLFGSVASEVAGFSYGTTNAEDSQENIISGIKSICRGKELSPISIFFPNNPQRGNYLKSRWCVYRYGHRCKENTIGAIVGLT